MGEFGYLGQGLRHPRGFRQADIHHPLEYERRERGGSIIHIRRPYEAVMRDFERITGLERSHYGSPLGDRAMDKYRKVYPAGLS